MKKEIINELRGSAVQNPIEQEYVTNYGLNYPEMRSLSASKSGSPTPGTAWASIEKAAAAAEEEERQRAEEEEQARAEEEEKQREEEEAEKQRQEEEAAAEEAEEKEEE